MRHFIAVTLLVTFSAFAQEPPPAQPPAKKPPTRSGEVYKWVDANGVIHYTDKPPKENAQPARLPPLQTYREGTLPDLKKFDKAAGKPITNVGPQLQVVTPSSEEVFRGGERTVPVAVVVTPPLSGDQRLVYMLDDKPQPGPTTNTSYAFTEVDRGTHTASVAVVDATGAEMSRSQSVTFYVMPPIAKRP
jgi:hypothetical protein